MNINSINSIRISSNKLNSNSSKYSANTSFTAKKFPSGIYSDWFVSALEKRINLSTKEFDEWTASHLSNFRKYREEKQGLLACFSKIFSSVEGDVKVRKQDIIDLKTDLKRKSSSTSCTSYADDNPYIERYSSERDRKRQVKNDGDDHGMFYGGGNETTGMDRSTNCTYG